MALTTYSYTVASTANAIVDLSSLHDEVQANQQITIALERIDLSGADDDPTSVIDVVMRDPLPGSPVDQAAVLSTVVAAHTGVSTAEQPDRVVVVTEADTAVGQIRRVYLDATLRAGSSQDMGVDGSSVPVTYLWAPPAGEVWMVDQIRIYIEDPGGANPSGFGAMEDPLANGLQVLWSISAVEYEQSNLADNVDVVMAFQQLTTWGGGGDDDDESGWFDSGVLVGVSDLVGSVRLDGAVADAVLARVRDDLTKIKGLRMSIRAWRVLP